MTCPKSISRRLWPGNLKPMLSRDDLLDRFTKVDFQSLLPGNLQPPRIEAKLVQQRGMDVGHVVTIFDGVETKLVGCAVYHAPLDPTAGHPRREAERMVVAAVSTLRSGSPAELGRPDDDRLVEQPAPFQIGQQASNRPVDLKRTGLHDSCRRPL